MRVPFLFVDLRPVLALDIGARSSAGAARPRAAVRLEAAHPSGDGIGVALARLPAPDPVVDHDAAVLAFPLLGDLRQPQAGATERGRLPRIGVHLADDQVPVRVGVVVHDHDREVVFEAERAQGAVGELDLLAAGRGLTGGPRDSEVRVRVAQLPPAGGHARPLFEERRIGDPSLHHPQQIEALAVLCVDIEEARATLARIEDTTWGLELTEIDGERFVVLPVGTLDSRSWTVGGRPALKLSSE